MQVCCQSNAFKLLSKSFDLTLCRTSSKLGSSLFSSYFRLWQMAAREMHDSWHSAPPVFALFQLCVGLLEASFTLPLVLRLNYARGFPLLRTHSLLSVLAPSALLPRLNRCVRSELVLESKFLFCTSDFRCFGRRSFVKHRL